MWCKHKLVKSKFKCPKCKSSCLYDINDDLYQCNRPLVSSTGEVKGSCGKFYSNGVRFN